MAFSVFVEVFCGGFAFCVHLANSAGEVATDRPQVVVLAKQSNAVLGAGLPLSLRSRAGAIADGASMRIKSASYERHRNRGT